jgi:hypothetical protein
MKRLAITILFAALCAPGFAQDPVPMPSATPSTSQPVPMPDPRTYPPREITTGFTFDVLYPASPTPSPVVASRPCRCAVVYYYWNSQGELVSTEPQVIERSVDANGQCSDLDVGLPRGTLPLFSQIFTQTCEAGD